LQTPVHFLTIGFKTLVREISPLSLHVDELLTQGPIKDIVFFLTVKLNVMLLKQAVPLAGLKTTLSCRNREVESIR
jgi:hypothetical protein